MQRWICAVAYQQQVATSQDVVGVLRNTNNGGISVPAEM
jgi:hypothetical protein